MDASLKKLAVIGSTGSIGRQTLDIVRSLPDKFKVIGLAAGENLGLLADQVAEFKPALVYYKDRSNRLKADGFRLASLEEIAADPEVDLVVMATSGKAGLSPAIAAIEAGKKVALSNKEPLVMAGETILTRVRRNAALGAEVLPVDSEHSAIWQCLRGEARQPARIILTASGGPFRHYSPAQLEGVTVEEALRHPSWQMGKKVTIDSATLMNKGLEVIEAHWLFDMPYDKIDILIHPQSIVHSMIELADGSIKAQLSYPDMRFPIQYALSYPERLPNPSLPGLDWQRVSCLSFETPDYAVFPCLQLALEAGKCGGTYPAVLCAADEVAVEHFLKGRLRFTDIARLISGVMEKHRSGRQSDLEEVLEADAWARCQAEELAGSLSKI